jgi:hypothetical protein
VDITHVSGLPVHFSFQLMGYVEDEWVELVRIDNSHEGPPHRHIFHPDAPHTVKPFVAALPESLVGWAQEHLEDEAEHYLDEYRRRLRNMKGR